MAKKPTSRTKTAKPKKKTGRPTLYRPAYAEQAYKLCLLSATDKELAAFFEVSEDSIHEWKKVHSEFTESITRGKMVADANVAQRLYERAMGYEHADVYPSSYQGKVTLTTVTKYYPPDTQAASLWLRNRQPAKWRDKQEQQHSGEMVIRWATDGED